MGKLKIGFVLDDTLDSADGVQQYILTLGAWLTAQGHSVHYLVGQTDRTDVPNVHSLSRNIKVRFNGNYMSTPRPASKRAIRQLLSRHQFDVLHVQMPYSPWLAGRVVAAAPPSTAVVGTFHIAPHSRLVTTANQLLGRWNKKTLRRFDAFFSTSTAAAAFAKKTHGIDSSVLPNVVRADQFRAARPFATPHSVPNIVFLGRLVPRKGCQVLLEAVNLLQKDYTQPFQVTVCGKGPLQSTLEAYAQAHSLQDTVTFTGFVSETDKARHLKTADIAVFPSTGGESFGIVLIEAMAAEHPVVVAADNEGYHTVLAPHPASLVPVNDAAALAGRLRALLQDTADYQETLAWQHGYIKQFDVAIAGPRLVSRYLQALRARRTV